MSDNVGALGLTVTEARAAEDKKVTLNFIEAEYAVNFYQK